jgi:hypothetical protein
LRKPEKKECDLSGPNKGHSTIYKDETVEELERSLLSTVHEATTAAVELAMEDLFRQMKRSFEHLATEMLAQLVIIKDQIARLEKQDPRVGRSEDEASEETSLPDSTDASGTTLELKRRISEVPHTRALKKDDRKRSPAGPNQRTPPSASRNKDSLKSRTSKTKTGSPHKQKRQRG